MVKRLETDEEFFDVLLLMKEYQEKQGYTKQQYKEAVQQLLDMPSQVWIIPGEKRAEGYFWFYPMTDKVMVYAQAYAPKQGHMMNEAIQQIKALGYESIISVVDKEAVLRLAVSKYGFKEMGTLIQRSLKES